MLCPLLQFTFPGIGTICIIKLLLLFILWDMRGVNKSNHIQQFECLAIRKLPFINKNMCCEQNLNVIYSRLFAKTIPQKEPTVSLKVKVGKVVRTPSGVYGRSLSLFQ